MPSEAHSYPERLEVAPLTKLPKAVVSVPGSKSITNRALLLGALIGGFEVRNALQSEDTELMISALFQLDFLLGWHEGTNNIWLCREDWGFFESDSFLPSHADLFVGNSGTTMRFLCALVSLGHGTYRLDGTPRMRERPIEDMLSALRQVGVDATSENGDGCPPAIIRSRGWQGNHVRVKGDVSSQFLSGLLMVAAFLDEEITIDVDGQLVSVPYVRMTVEMLRSLGLSVQTEDWSHFRFPASQESPNKFEFLVEPDASAASYLWAAAAITGGTITVSDLTRDSLQGDTRFVDLLGQMGCRVETCSSGITVHGRPLHGIDVDMNGISDTVMTLAAVACFAEGPTTIRNVAHIRHKETDRISALATELRKIGAEVEEYADGLKITPRPLHGAEIETYNDHRMAMSMALVGLKVPGIVILNPGCVAKTYPGFWEDLERLRL
ncbi:MAG TPA: 3-phosphoshikimate 1-carboxyvinyltransferase [Gemmataceae bacterium]|jgi:3-phosphoshikimate 1-carboxyvinyltransferase|nr:3-phosphoshikimate 1-carboxyvinyltransferase [Gemmataceae bacterium]